MLNSQTTYSQFHSIPWFQTLSNKTFASSLIFNNNWRVPSLIIFYFFRSWRLWSLRPLAFKISSNTNRRVRNTHLRLWTKYSLNEHSAWSTNSFIDTLKLYFYWVDCIAQKKPRLRILWSSKLGGWDVREMFQVPTLETAAKNEWLLSLKWVFGFSCWSLLSFRLVSNM